MPSKTNNLDFSLEGIRVVELADRRGEFCGKLLGNMGADVIKVEPPDGAETRRLGPFYNDEQTLENSIFWWHYNQNKRSVTVDFDSTLGGATFDKLIGSADVLIETVKPGGMALAGTSWDEVRSKYPNLIVLTISDFGLEGPWSDFIATDLVALAVGGQMMASGYPQLEDGTFDTPPIAPQMHQSTHITGCLGAMDVLAALYWREHGGLGQRIDLALHAATNSCTENWLSWYIIGGNVQPRRPQFPEMFTNDGKYMVVMLGLSQAEWERIVSLLEEYGMAEDLTNPSYADPNYRKQPGPRSHIDQVIQTFLATEDSDTVWHAAQRHGVIWAPIREPHDSIKDEHFFNRGNFAEVAHPELGKSFWDAGSPWVSDQLKWKVGTRAPFLGEHTAEVLTELGI